MKTIKKIGNTTMFMLPSIILNNKKTFNLLFLYIIAVFVFVKYSCPIIWFALFLLSTLLLLFFLSPLKLIINSSGIQYQIFWKIKWSKIESYVIKDEILILKTTDGKERKVKNINKSISSEIDLLIKQNINV